MDAPDSSVWPSWIQSTLAALAGFVGAIFASARAWSRVQRNAEEAKAATDSHGPRIAALEKEAAVRDDRMSAMRATLDEVRADVKVILRGIRS